MGFHSPATDYQTQRFIVDQLCSIDGNCRVIETSCGWAVINLSLKPKQGNTLLVAMDGRNQFARLHGKALITEEGEAIEGEALDDVTVHGVVTHLLKRVINDNTPAI